MSSGTSHGRCPTDGEVQLQPMLGALMRAPLRALSDRISAELIAAGFVELRPSHLTVFQGLERDGSRVTDIAARAHMTKQSMGALVDDLVRWGYVERHRDPRDARAHIVVRTERGWAVERLARETVRAFEIDWERLVGARRMRVFRAVLQAFALAEADARNTGPD